MGLLFGAGMRENPLLVASSPEVVLVNHLELLLLCRIGGVRTLRIHDSLMDATLLGNNSVS